MTPAPSPAERPDPCPEPGCRRPARRDAAGFLRRCADCGKGDSLAITAAFRDEALVARLLGAGAAS